MANRAIITTPKKELSVYLHWNGGLDSVSAFLEYCKIKQFRCPSEDSYGWARLCQVVGNFFGCSLSVGIDRYRNSDTKVGDNGLYVIQNWEIIERVGSHCPREGYERAKLLLDIDKSQPESEQLGEDFFKSQEIEVSELKS